MLRRPDRERGSGKQNTGTGVRVGEILGQNADPKPGARNRCSQTGHVGDFKASTNPVGAVLSTRLRSLRDGLQTANPSKGKDLTGSFSNPGTRTPNPETGKAEHGYRGKSVMRLRDVRKRGATRTWRYRIPVSRSWITSVTSRPCRSLNLEPRYPVPEPRDREGRTRGSGRQDTGTGKAKHGDRVRRIEIAGCKEMINDEDLKAWQKGIGIVHHVYGITSE